MKIRLGTIELTSRELEAIAYREDGGIPQYDQPTNRKATRQEAVDRIMVWLQNELSECVRQLDDADDVWSDE